MAHSDFWSGTKIFWVFRDPFLGLVRSRDLGSQIWCRIRTFWAILHIGHVPQPYPKIGSTRTRKPGFCSGNGHFPGSVYIINEKFRSQIFVRNCLGILLAYKWLILLKICRRSFQKTKFHLFPDFPELLWDFQTFFAPRHSVKAPLSFPFSFSFIASTI